MIIVLVQYKKYILYIILWLYRSCCVLPVHVQTSHNDGKRDCTWPCLPCA